LERKDSPTTTRQIRIRGALTQSRGFAARDIAHRGYDAIAVRHDVERWLASVNPRGSAGDACEQGRCGLPFDEDGCGTMNEEHVS